MVDIHLQHRWLMAIVGHSFHSGMFFASLKVTSCSKISAYSCSIVTSPRARDEESCPTRFGIWDLVGKPKANQESRLTGSVYMVDVKFAKS